jgi:predicted AAA+ superfamily ATPase
MDTRFLPHNSHLEDGSSFELLDPNLRRLGKVPLVYRSPLLESLPRQPGIYTITGGRQVGKTTLLKQWMQCLLAEGVLPATVIYLSGELIDDHHSLVRLIGDVIDEFSQISYLLVDEVTYIRSWDKGIKFLADAGRLEDVCLVLTGSDMLILNEARMRFPGRRGMADEVDFHLYPLNFGETVRLKNILQDGQEYVPKSGLQGLPDATILSLFSAFDEYLRHGGFLTAINDMAVEGRILPATLRTYSDWIRGDMLKRGKQEHYLREIIMAVIKRYGSQITWNNLLADLSIDHPKTVADYVQLLAGMDAVFILPALQEELLCAAPKKAKKVFFTDPFIYHAMFNWISADSRDGYRLMEEVTFADAGRMGQLVEGSAAALCRRILPTYYIKARGGEVDIACVRDRKVFPVEVKWTSQIRPHQLKQIKKYSQGQVWTKNRSIGELDGLTRVPLPVALFFLENMLNETSAAGVALPPSLNDS